jgi:hypothetical protein
MSWHKIVLPLIRLDPYNTEIDPDVVNIGKLGWACYERANKPAGFAMFHAAEGSGKDEKRIVYLTPVATSLCTEIGESYKLEPCDVPARDEPEMAFVFGDPLMMGQLQDSYEAKAANSAA